MSFSEQPAHPRVVGPLDLPDPDVAHLSFVARPRGFYVRIGKPVFDRVVGALLLVVAAPLLGLVALAVRTRIGRPVFFRQARAGVDGVPFAVLKFRTMRTDRRQGNHPVLQDRRLTHKSATDPRHTALGRRLRKWSLDELPQLINVVRGEMSLVGPRPELVEIVERYEPWQHQRHLVKPGLTGLWQISRRGEGLMHLYTDVDLEYVATVSLRQDLSILARTIPAALGRSGT
jgi:lipopolysaccharide/colanic/teichoic acid biosynthesis glycosyltransferase